MSVELETRIRRATTDPAHDLPFDRVQARAEQLRRRRRARTGASGLVGVAAVAVMVGPLVGRGTMPSISPDPVGTADAPSSQPTSAGPASEDLSAWRWAHGGETMTLSTSAWADPSFEPLVPSHAGRWASHTQPLVDVATRPNPNGQGPPWLLATPHVGPAGHLLLVPGTDSSQVLTVDAGGSQHLAVLEAEARVAAVWAPGGYWFLLTRAADGVAIQRVGADGEVGPAVPVPGYDPAWGAVLHSSGEEVWVSTGFDRDESRGPQAARLATDGGDVVVDELQWVDLADSPVARPDETSETTSDGGTYVVSLDGGEASVSLEHQDGVDADVTVLERADTWSTTSSEHLSTTPGGAVPEVHATVAMATGDTLWVTGFPDITGPSGVMIGPAGTPWFVRITPDGYSMTDLTPPSSVAR